MADQEKISQRVTLTIYGDTYHLKTDEPEYLTALAETLDKKIREQAQVTKFAGSNQIIMLTALQILDDYTKLHKDYDELVAMLDDR